MNRIDAQTLAQNLNALAEVFDKKPVSAKALEVWFDTLKEFPTEKVMGKLINWPKSHIKFPAPSEVWKECNEYSIREREEKAAIERAENVREPRADDAVARHFIAKIKALLAKPRKTPIEYWEMVLREAPKGSLAESSAKECLQILRGRKGQIDHREPGQDDEELAA